MYPQSKDAVANVPGDKLLEQLTGLRDAFVERTQSSGARCGIPPPAIVLTDIASFGNYDPKTNRLSTPRWEQLTSQERTLFVSLAGPGASEGAAQAIFERGTHRWVFVHEMGHWWQMCTHANVGRSHYGAEYDANRIAAAYWREVDPKLLAGLVSGFNHILAGAPDPVPAGQSVADYFNEHYEKLAHSPAYTWFQAQMIQGVNNEMPAPSFVKSLDETKSDLRR
jgi:hypothetical protein